MSYSPKKRTFYHFSVGGHDNGQQFEQLIFIDITLFFIEIFRWKKIKFQSKNLIHPSIDDYLLLKNQRGIWQRPRKIYFIGGTWQRGNMAKGIYCNTLDFQRELTLRWFSKTKSKSYKRMKNWMKSSIFSEPRKM